MNQYRFHINNKGNVGACKAKQNNCPFGSNEEHFETKNEARKEYERRQRATFAFVSLDKEMESKIDKSMHDWSHGLLGFSQTLDLTDGTTYEMLHRSSEDDLNYVFFDEAGKTKTLFDYGYSRTQQKFYDKSYFSKEKIKDELMSLYEEGSYLNKDREKHMKELKELFREDKEAFEKEINKIFNIDEIHNFIINRYFSN